jgi:hypothetical protein
MEVEDLGELTWRGALKKLVISDRWEPQANSWSSERPHASRESNPS